MNRSRMVAVVLASMPVVAVSAVTAPAARADPECADVWLVQQDGAREYKAGPDNCVETGMSHWFTLGTEPTSTNTPGPYMGAGLQIMVASP